MPKRLKTAEVIPNEEEENIPIPGGQGSPKIGRRGKLALRRHRKRELDLGNGNLQYHKTNKSQSN